MTRTAVRSFVIAALALVNSACSEPTHDNPEPPVSVVSLAGVWTGQWAWTGPAAGCTYSDSGAFSMTLTPNLAGVVFVSTDVSAAGIQMRDRREGFSCVLVSVVTGTGTAGVSLVAPYDSLTLTIKVPLEEISLEGKAAFSGNTLTGSFKRTNGIGSLVEGGGNGSFTLTRK